MNTVRPWVRQLAAAAATAAVAAGVTACGGSAPTPSAPPATGTFVGKVGDAELIAVVVGSAGDSRGLLYGPALTNPDGSARTTDELTSEWFDGVALNGDKLEGRSASGVILAATLTADGARGTVSGPGRATQEFVATPATGTAGLYDVAYNPADRTLRGSSPSGATITGTAPGTDVQLSVPTTLTVTPAGEAPTQISVNFFVGENPTVSQLGFIIAQDGSVRGGPRKGKGTSGGSGGSGGQYTWPILD
jgi:hypothetical protein